MKYSVPCTQGQAFSWRDANIPLILVLVFGMAYALVSLRDPSRLKEEGHIYRVGFSHPEVREKVGLVKDVNISYRPTKIPSRNNPRDWERRRKGDIVEGRARVEIRGEKDFVFIAIYYKYTLSSDLFEISRVEFL